MNSFVSVEEPETSAGEIDEVVLSTDDNDSDHKLKIDSCSSGDSSSELDSEEKTPEVILHTRFSKCSSPFPDLDFPLNEVDLEKVEKGVYQVPNSFDNLVPVEVDNDNCVDLMYLPLETVVQNCVDHDINRLFESSDEESFDGFPDISDNSFEGFDGLKSNETLHLERIKSIKKKLNKKRSSLRRSSGLSQPDNKIQNYSKSATSSFYNSAFSNFKEKADVSGSWKSGKVKQEDKENLNKSHFEGSPKEKPAENRMQSADFIGEHCDKVGCTISWLESGNVKEIPVKITNGIVYELNEFAKRIAWEPIYVCYWLFRLNGVLQHDISDEVQKKINSIIKRHRALTVNYSGNRVTLKSKLTSFEAEVVSIFSNYLQHQNVLESPSQKSGLSIMRENHYDQDNIENPVVCYTPEKFNNSNSGEQPATKQNFPTVNIKKKFFTGNKTSKKNVNRDVDANVSYDDAINKSRNNIMSPSSEYSTQSKYMLPNFKEDGTEIGFHCRAAGIGIKQLNKCVFKYIITNGILYELYEFFQERKTSLTCLVHTLYRLSGISFDKSQVLSTMAKIHELVKVSWDEEMLKSRNMPFEQFYLPGNENSVDKNDAEDNFYNEEFEPQSRKKLRTAEYDEDDSSNDGYISGSNSVNFGQNDAISCSDSKVFDLNSTKGSKGSITRGDIVYLYTKWLKKKMEGKDSVFVADLSNDVKDLIVEREVEFVRIPVGTLMSSSVKLFEEFKTLSKTDMNGASTYLQEDWIEDIKSILNVSHSSSLTMGDSDERILSSMYSEGHTDIFQDKNSPYNRTSNQRHDKSKLSENVNLKQNVKSSFKKHSNFNGRSVTLSANSSISEDHEVEKIVGYRLVKVGDGKMIEYRIRWVGFTSKDDSWINQNDLNCPEILNNFWNALSKQREKKLKSQTDCAKKDENKSNHSRLSSEDALNMPFLESTFFSSMTNNLNANVIDYQHEDVDNLFNKRIKITKKDVLTVYDSWRMENQQRLLIGSNEKLDIDALKSRVKKLMALKKVRNFNSNCIIDVCFKMSLMKEKLKDPRKIDEYLAGDFMDLMQVSQRHQDAVLADNLEKKSKLKQIEEKRKSELANPLSEKVCILNNMERESEIISKGIESHQMTEKKLNLEIKTLRKILEPELDKKNMKKLSQSVVKELESLGVNKAVLGDLVNIASNLN